jgi:hypothetical protein
MTHKDGIKISQLLLIHCLDSLKESLDNVKADRTCLACDQVQQPATRLKVNSTNPCSSPISFPKHARSQVKGGHSSGEIELIRACDWLTADSTLDFQREFYACLAIVGKYKQGIWNFPSAICYFFTLKSIENN